MRLTWSLLLLNLLVLVTVTVTKTRMKPSKNRKKTEPTKKSDKLRTKKDPSLSANSLNRGMYLAFKAPKGKTTPPMKSKVEKEEKDKNRDMKSNVVEEEKDKVKNRDEPIRFAFKYKGKGHLIRPAGCYKYKISKIKYQNMFNRV